MKFGIGLPQREDADLCRDVVDVAVGAEDNGFDSLWARDRPRRGSEDRTADPLSLLASVSTYTASIRLGTDLLVDSPLHPVRLAKALATIDVLGGRGRLIAGLGNCDNVSERPSADSSTATRHTSLDGVVDALRSEWGSALPPIQIMAGVDQTEIRQLTSELDGWLPSALSPAAVRSTTDELHARLVRTDRSPATFEVIYRAELVLSGEPVSGDRKPFTGTRSQITDDAVALAGTGVTEIVLDFQSAGAYLPPESLLTSALQIRTDFLTRLE